MNYPPRGNERLLVQFSSKLRESELHIVSLKSIFLHSLGYTIYESSMKKIQVHYFVKINNI